MPSIQDVADQINARLDQITTHTANTAQNTANTVTQLTQVNTRLSQIDNTLGIGFANVSQGVFALLQVQLAALQLTDHMRRQNDTIICELVNANNLLCNIVRKTGRLVQLGEADLVIQKRVEGIMARTHGEAAGDYDRHLELEQKIEKCCPPSRPVEERCPEVCKAPTFGERPLPTPDWRPLPGPRNPDPIG